MKNRIDPLIAERAPWLYRDGRLASAFRPVLNHALRYDETLRLATDLRDVSGPEVMAHMVGRLARHVEARGLDHLPRQGGALVVANHPTGIADGIILYGLLSQLRPDVFFFANKDILRVLPQLAPMIAPVEWRRNKRSHGKTRETMAFLRDAVTEGRLGVIFPSGRLAKRRGLRLHERPWMASAAMLARKYDLPVVPINIRARNSALFYLFDRIHPTLRDITLFHETLNKDRQPFFVTVGEPVSPTALPKSSDAGIALLRRAVLALGENGEPSVSLVSTSRHLQRA